LDSIDDSVVTNNNDREKVLATVAYSIVEFSNHYGNPFIMAVGSTPSRTRLYQMGIAGLLDEIKNDFAIYGWKDSNWQDFHRNINYEAFLVRKK
jgi:hypothetical protein